LIEASKEASDAGVILGFENTLPADTNASVLARVNSPALKVFYDIGNSTNIGHYDVPREIRFLGRSRICQFHIKDKSYLGTGKVDVPGCLKAIGDIGYSGFCVLETSAPSGIAAADASRNLKIFKNMLSEAKLRS
jgi:sugar phosphate isomerase/epimerase